MALLLFLLGAAAFPGFATTAPVISPIPDIATAVSGPTATVYFTVEDAETAASDLLVTITSSNQAIVQDSSIQVSGSGRFRNFLAFPVPGAIGEVLLTITVRDADGLFTSRIVNVQFGPFALWQSGSIGLAHSAAAWVDLDNNGDMEFVVFGLDEDSLARSYAFVREGGAGAFVDLAIPALSAGSCAWGDFDNDGLVDLVLTGQGSNQLSLATQVYRNLGNRQFAWVTNLAGLSASGAAWGDSDNDGDLDLAIAGVTSGGGQRSRIYRNDGGGRFVELNSNLLGVSYSSVAWGDVDLDGDNDLLIAGTPSNFPTNAVSRIYRNDGNNTFAPSTAMLPGMMDGTAALGDVDNDGDLDVFLAGQGTNWEGGAWVLRNEGGFVFRDLLATFNGARYGSGGWGDYDNDGWLDLAYTGEYGRYVPGVWLYRNRGGLTFANASTGLPLAEWGSVAWGDVDGDGDLDLGVCGRTNFGVRPNLVLQVYRNNSVPLNPPPAAPVAQGVDRITSFVTFRWAPSSDANQGGGLTYNLRVGRRPGGDEVMSGMADPATGQRRLPAQGNAGARTNWTLRGLAPGLYYWSVQAIDHSFRASPFAPEQTFVINLPPGLGGVALGAVAVPVGLSPLRFPFTVNDELTPVTNLIVTAQSDNPALIPASGVAIVGNGTARELILTPVPDTLGTTRITVTVQDEHGGVSSDGFYLTVQNTPPSLSPFTSPLIVSMAAGDTEIPFTVTDAESAPDRINVTAISSNLTLLPADGIRITGSGSNRVLTLTATPGEMGVAAVRVTAADPHGGLSMRSFLLLTTNLTPTISAIPNQVWPVSPEPVVLAFQISDAETLADDLRLELVASDTGFVPTNNMSFGGTGTNRQLTIVVPPSASGTMIMAIRVHDGQGASTTTAFEFRVEDFSEVDVGLPAFQNGSLAWGDFDHDDDLDLLMTGRLAVGSVVSRVYRNDQGRFVDAGAGLTGMELGACAWADYDGDGDLDIFISGEPAGVRSVRLYRNNWPAPGFSYVAAMVPGSIQAASLDLADWDHDGDLDLLTTGRSSGFPYAQVHRLLSPHVAYAQAYSLNPASGRGSAWGDFDVDGAFDVLLSGSASPQVFRNIAPTNFAGVSLPVPALSQAAAAWGDLDNDGDLDVAMTGGVLTNGFYQPVTRLFRNDGSAGFVPAGTNVANVQNGHVTWADYNNDGWQDLLITGNDGTPGTSGQYVPVSHLYRNNGTGTLVLQTNALRGVDGGSQAWGDYDRDGDLDVLLVGRGATGRLHRNNSARSNSPPAAPTALAANVTRNSVRLSWGAGADLEQAGGLTYNLRVGTNPVFEQMPAMASGSGHRRLPQPGNAGAAQARLLTNVPPGTYTWAVQAIDNARAGSVFSAGLTFTITNELPTISTIPNQSTPRNRSTPVLSFYVSDLETSASGLVVGGFTSDPRLVSEEGIRLGGTGGMRTVQILPTGAAEGTVTITLAVSDALGGIASTAFTLEITQAAPDLVLPSAASTPFNTPTGPIALTVSDPDNAAEELTLSGRSLNPALVSDGNIIFGGAGSNRTVTLWPALNQFGVVGIVITLRDPAGAVDERTLELTVQNAAPVVAGLTNRSVLPGINLIAMPFTVADLETPASSLNVTVEVIGIGTNFIEGLSLSGSGSNRVLELALLQGRFGTQAVQAIVADAGGLSVTSRFVVRLEFFTGMPAGLANIALSSIAVGDYDSDWDADILLSGALTGGPSTTHLYRNDDAFSFVLKSNGIPINLRAAVAWGDYDNDSDLDLAFIHRQGSRIYENDGLGSFQVVDAALPSVNANGASWGDYDGDGRQDLFIIGITPDPGGPAAFRIYRNAANGQFEEIPTAFPALAAATGAWADYDNDGDLDVAVSGQYGGAALSATLIFRQHEGRLEMIASPTRDPIPSGSLAWGDPDNDGDLDLAVMGGTVQPGRVYFYRNEDGVFMGTPVSLIGASSGSLAWGDFDNDGWSDLVMSGSGIDSAQVYRNRGDGTFQPIEPALLAINQGSYVWSDFDRDGDLDLLGSGSSGANFTPATRLYRNNGLTPNSPPAAPTQLTTTIDLNNDVVFQWAIASDAQTPAAALRYNLRVGTSPGGNEVVTSESESVDGYRKVERFGNGSARTQAALRDLPAGRYYWSVQALDSAFAGSAFALEETFSVTNARPLISAIPNQVIFPGRPSALVPFTVTDQETPATALDVALINSNPEVLPTEAILLGGEGTNRTLSFLPGNERAGETTISVLVTDTVGAQRRSTFQVKIEYFSVITNVHPALVSAAAWGDVDNDGDLDLAIAGYDTNQFGGYPQSYARLWRNLNGTNFIISGSQLSPPGEWGSLAWGDFDGDGDIDLLQSGRSVISVGILITQVYRNNISSFSFFPHGLPAVWSSAADWGDYDNDGDLDLVLAGRTQINGTNLMARIYQNRGDSWFVQASVPLLGMHAGAALWADIDQDRDLDLLLTGAITTATNAPGMTQLYRNDGGTNFTKLPDHFAAVSSSAAAWADFDNDGDLDLALSGRAASNAVTAIYRNLGNGDWMDVNAALPGVSAGTLSWGDFDGDGRMDLLMTGTTNALASGALTKVYRQTEAGSFVDSQIGLPAVSAASAAWGDCDGDGDLDLYLGGPTTSNRVSQVLRNNSGRPIAAPQAPHQLDAQVEGRKVSLRWRSPADPPISQTGVPLSGYNVRIGRSPDGNQVMPSHSSATGFRRLAELGNVTGSNAWTLNNLAPGSYFWSVQAINTSLGGSPFAPEGVFRITNTVPVLERFQVEVPEDTVRMIPLRGMDPDPQSLSYTIVTGPTNGFASVNGTNLVYQSHGNYFGPDSLTCQAFDGLDYSLPAVIELTVVPVPDVSSLQLSLAAPASGETWITLQGEPYAWHAIEVSQDLVTWVEWTRVQASPDGRVNVVDPGPRLAQRFYRPNLQSGPP